MVKKSNKSSRVNKSKKSAQKVKLNRGALFALIFGVVGVATLALSYAAPSRCTPQPPSVQFHNTYAWASWGSWAKPGETATYGVQLYNNSCGSATVSSNITAPAGFIIDQPTISASLRSKQISNMIYVKVTSPASVTVTDHPVTATVSSKSKSGEVTNGTTSTSFYKVYTSDTTAPTQGLSSSNNGGTLSGTATLHSTFRDDRMTRRIDLYIDYSLVTSETNIGVMSSLSLYYDWATRGVSKGAHSVVWKAYDDFNNEAVVSWTVNVQ